MAGWRLSGGVVLGLLLAWVAILGVFPTFDYDLYWHLAQGREMLAQGRIIEEEVFSFTVPGTPFHNHEWLSQIGLWLAWSTGGVAGLLALKLALLLAVFALLWRTAGLFGAAPVDRLAVGALVALTGLFRFTERPHLVSYLGLAVLMYLLFGWRQGRVRDRMLWLLPPIMLLWDCMHGAVKGAVLIGAFTVAETVTPWAAARFAGLTGLRPLAPQRLRQLWLVVAVTAGVMLLSPWGPRSWGMFAAAMGADPLVAQIQEFVAPKFADHPLFLGLLAACLAAAAVAGRGIDATRLLVVLPFALLALRHVRIVVPFALVAFPVLAAALTVLRRRVAAQGRPRVAAAVVGVLLAGGVGMSAWVKLLGPASPNRFGYGQDETFLPFGSARFIADNPVAGNIYSPGKFGGYLAYTLHPRHPIFMYMHAPVFTAVWQSLERPDFLDHWRIQAAIAGDAEEIRALARQGWAPVFWEPAAVTFLRPTEANQALIERFRIRLFRPLMDDARIRTLAADPRARLVLAQEMADYLHYRRDDRLAARLAEMLIALDPAARRALAAHALTFNAGEPVLRLAAAERLP